jgi:VWFA-related protein
MSDSPRRFVSGLPLALLALGVAFPAPAQTVRERVSVDAVSITVEAHDRSGRAVRDLSQSDVALTVDGNAVPIDSFSSEGGLVVAASAAPRPARAANETNAVPPTSPPAPPRSREIAIFADESETNSFDRRDVYKELIRFLEAPASEPRRYLVTRFSGTELKIECAWTSDPAAAKAAIARLRDHPRIERIPGPAVAAQEHNRTTLLARGVEIPDLQRHLYAALLETIAAFPDGPARREIFFISGGTVIESPFDQARNMAASRSLTNDVRDAGSRRTPARLDGSSAIPSRFAVDAFSLWSAAMGFDRSGLWTEDITAKAAERDIEIVPIAAEAFDRGVGGGADQKNLSPAYNVGDAWISPGLGVGQVMSAIAEETGAEAILVPRRTASLLAARESERAGFTVVFHDPHTGDLEFHAVRLTCSRPGVKLTYRHGYRISAPEERTLDRVVARFLQPGPGDDPLTVAASMAPATSESGRSVTRLTLRYTPPRETEPSEQRDLSLIAVGQNGQGDRTQPIRWTGTAEEEGDAGAYRAALDLGSAPESFTWSLAVRDEETGLISFVTLKPSK